MKLIALDIDGTLLYADNIRLVLRPYLKEFLQFCFQNFDCVGLWTAGSRDYLNFIYDDILTPLLFEVNPQFKFDFIFSEEECDNKYEKPLSKLSNENFNETNSLIVDDHIESFQCNPDNGILLPSFNPDDEFDDSLIEIIVYLRYLLRYFGARKTFKGARKCFTVRM